jgi:phage shock protein PspC (stress-responsive transcriptional regulator)
MEFKMQALEVQSAEPYVALPLRTHTILGVCEGLGEDFGFNPIFLRIPLAAAVIWNPLIAFGTYFGLGAIVLVSRMLFPRPKDSAAPASSDVHSDNDADRMPIAA